jgi:hypothetical protein
VASIGAPVSLKNQLTLLKKETSFDSWETFSPNTTFQKRGVSAGKDPAVFHSCPTPKEKDGQPSVKRRPYSKKFNSFGACITPILA